MTLSDRTPSPESQHPSLIRYVVLVWLCLAAAIAYVCRVSINVTEKAIRAEVTTPEEVFFGLQLKPVDQMSWVMGAFFLSYAILQLPAAWIVRLWGSRITLPIFSAAWSLTAAWSAFAGGWLDLAAARFGMGAAQAGIFTASTQTIARWFPLASRAFPSGALASFMSLGGALGTYLTAQWLYLRGNDSWRVAFAVYAVPGLIWAVGFYLWFREWPADHRAVNDAERRCIGTPPVREGPSLPAMPTPWLTILSSPAMWLISAQQFFRAAGYIFFATWFPTYLQETRQVSTASIGWLSSLPLAAVVLGSPFGGFLSDWVLRTTNSRRLARQGVATTALLCCALLAGLAFPIADPALAVLLIACGQFFHAVAGPCAYTITIDVGGKHLTTVFSLMNMAGNLGAVVFPLVVPALVKRTGGWEIVLPFYIAITLAAAFCWILINPNGTVTGDKDS